MELESWTWAKDSFPWETRLLTILQSWEGTPYKDRQCSKGGAVDCVRFTCAVYDELDNVSSRDYLRLPPDQALHSKDSSIQAMKIIRENYMPNYSVTDQILEPGDFIVMGFKDGGPGHSMIAGPQNRIWHTDGLCVTPTGLVTPPRMELIRVYRAVDREKRWLR